MSSDILIPARTGFSERIDRLRSDTRHGVHMLPRLIQACSLMIGAVLVAACGSGEAPTPLNLPPTQPVEAVSAETNVTGDLARFDRQGAVEFVVLPLNLTSGPSQLLEFEISMNTHSVDLSMDLSLVSTLESDLGVQVAAGFWSGGSGHHVNGVLTFPDKDRSGRPILDGASVLTLRIEGVDAPVREFQWEVQQNS